MRPRILLIDNYDSFTYNLVQAFLRLGASVVVKRNDEIGRREAVRLDPTHLVVSPGPGRPSSAGVSRELVAEFSRRIPVLGVCLGMQVIAESAGGDVVRSRHLMHGKISAVDHDRRTIFSGLDSPFVAGRYHSLAVREESLPQEIEVSARADDGEVMAIRVRGTEVEGVQFHPESILTPAGPRLLENFVAQREVDAR